MNISDIDVKEYLLSLSRGEQKVLLRELNDLSDRKGTISAIVSRREILDNKQGHCPHCGHPKYVKFGVDKGSQRYKCKSCNRNFTEYTGTWLEGIHKKELIDEYLQLMFEEKSLDKITELLGINKKTAFDWRHKILASLRDTDKISFDGITESDETFFLLSEKGCRHLEREGRKRGSTSSKKGISDEQVAVIVTADRQGAYEFDVAKLGRITKKSIEDSIGDRISPKTVLCTDSHVSYKGFAIDNEIEHHPLRADLKQFVKDGVFHIQHVNSLHNRLKKWITEKFWGVSTKYLQQYLNWFRMKEKLKNVTQPIAELVRRTLESTETIERYFRIEQNYEELLSSPI